ncbi:MAG: immunoglobulin domain-containing protein [Phycisphaerales bacterium]
MRSIVAMALAGACGFGSAQVVYVRADRTAAAAGETVNWTVSITGVSENTFLQNYDFNLNASDNALALASGFVDGLTPATNPKPGTPVGASLSGVSGAQSSVADPVNLTFGDVIIGVFAVQASNVPGMLSYSLTDGPNSSANIVRGRQGNDFGTVIFDGPAAVFSDSVEMQGVTNAPFTLSLTPDATEVAQGDTVVWTATISGDFGPDDYVQQYDLSFLASDPTLGVASSFMDNLDPVLGPTPGTPSMADLIGVSGAQSSILGPTVNGEITLGTFAVLVTEPGVLTYSIADGGAAPTDFLQIKPGSDFAPAVFNEEPNLAAGSVLVRELMPPQITSEPESVVTTAGAGDAAFTVVADDVSAYQWRFDGVPIVDGPDYSGTQTGTLLVNPSLATEGAYDVVLANFSGTTESRTVVLAVRQACPADINADGLLNLDDIDAFVQGFLGGCP